jgi:Viral coat protein (S domain).
MDIAEINAIVAKNLAASRKKTSSSGGWDYSDPNVSYYSERGADMRMIPLPIIPGGSFNNPVIFEDEEDEQKERERRGEFIRMDPVSRMLDESSVFSGLKRKFIGPAPPPGFGKVYQVENPYPLPFMIEPPPDDGKYDEVKIEPAGGPFSSVFNNLLDKWKTRENMKVSNMKSFNESMPYSRRRSYKRRRRNSGGYRRSSRLPYSLRKLAKDAATAQSNNTRAWWATKGQNDYNNGLGRVGGPQNLYEFGPSWAAATDPQRAARQAAGWRGRGDYKQWLKYIPRAIGGIGGALVGGRAGNWGGGAQAGWNAGANVSKFLGWGDYSQTNQLMGGDTVDGNQQMISVNSDNNQGDIYISHTEFIKNLTVTVSNAPTNSGFQIEKFELNPGLPATFPFLAQLAQNYVLYDFEGLIFQYKPTSGESGNASNALGKVIMATNYDPDDPLFVNAQQMENYDYANSCKPSVGMMHGIETDNRQQVTNMMYIRAGQGTKDRVFTDLGTFQVATEGVPVGGSGQQTQILGEIWVTYKVKLSRANLFGSVLANNAQFDTHRFTSTGIAIAPGPIFKSNANTIGVDVQWLSTSNQVKLVWPSSISNGAYLVWYQLAVQGTGLNAVQLNAPTGLLNGRWWLPGIPPQTGSLSFSAPGTASVAPGQNNHLGVTAIIVEAEGNKQASFNLNFQSTIGTYAASSVISIIIHATPLESALAGTN